MDDDEIIPFLLKLHRPTFFTLDFGFYKRVLCHQKYCFVCLEVGQYESASFVRRVLAHEAFDTEAKRLGKVVRAFHVGLEIWEMNAESAARIPWRQAALPTVTSIVPAWQRVLLF